MAHNFVENFSFLLTVQPIQFVAILVFSSFCIQICKFYPSFLPKRKKNHGSILVEILVFASLATVLISALVSWSGAQIRSGKIDYKKETAFQIAEAGIEYYRWHLAHAPADYKDGTQNDGPYVHQYKDKSGNIVGQFSLQITPSVTGSTKVTVRSTGATISDSIPSTRIIEADLAKPSLAKFAVVTENDIRFGEGTEVFGPIHSNGGVRFDGLAHNVITSALSDYNDPDHSGGAEFAVHTHISPIDPDPSDPVPVRADVFQAGREFPLPAVDFDKFTNDLSVIKSTAQSSGRYFGSSGELGYHIVLKIDDTFDLYKVITVVDVPQNCTQVVGEFGWGTWSIETETFVANYPFPASGIIFVEDHIWVNGQIDTARVTIASGRFPENHGHETSITVNENLLYTHYDGTDSIGLISQGNINAGMVSANVLRIDAALIAKNDRIGRYYYQPASDNKTRCAPYDVRDTITLYGMLASNERYGFAYSDGTGYQTRNIIYDANLLFQPPPNFPLTTDQYQVMSWRLVK